MELNPANLISFVVSTVYLIIIGLVYSQVHDTIKSRGGWATIFASSDAVSFLAAGIFGAAAAAGAETIAGAPALTLELGVALGISAPLIFRLLVTGLGGVHAATLLPLAFAAGSILAFLGFAAASVLTSGVTVPYS
jgi:hypothetical protein